MDVVIPSEFEVLAREQVEAGLVSSEQEAARLVLRDYAARIGSLRAAIEDGLTDVRAGRTVDARPVLARLIDETRAQHGE